MRDHETIEGLLAAQALGGLDDDDARALAGLRAEHGPDCQECAALERDFAEMAARFAMELDPAPLREGFEEEVMAAARSADRDVAAPPVRVLDAAAPSSWGRRIAVLAVAAALLLGAFVVYQTWGGGPFDRYVDSAATQVTLEGEAPGEMTIAYNPGEAGGAVVASGIPDAAGDDVYAVWTITGQTPSLIGCFTPTDGEIEERFDSQVNGTDLVAVTVEPPACPPAPTTNPIMSAPVPPS